MTDDHLSTLRKIGYYLVVGVAVLTIVITLLSLLHDVPLWWIKVLDFPRPQVLVLAVIVAVLFALLERRWTWGARALLLGLVVAVGWQVWFVGSYTPLVPERVAAAAPTQAADRKATVRLLQANVLMKNRNAADLLTIIRRADPDVILLEETDQWWVQALSALDNSYSYTLKRPFPNTYGMLLYSRLPLQQTQVRYLQHPDVPSFQTQVRLPNGRSFCLFAVHPVPPVPSKHPYNQHQQESELLQVGNLVDHRQLPTLVMGDFNDVAWSNTSRLFEARGRLNDVRVGRGLYPTFNAQHWPMRWPLDHLYASSEFRLVELRQLDKFGSDHFPLYAELTLP